MNKLSIYIESLALMFLIFCFTILFNGCEDVIDVELQNSEPQLVIDAWLTDQSEPQEIKLNQSQQYFDNSAPASVLNARVEIVRSDGTNYVFIDKDNKGVYIWQPASGQKIGDFGDAFTLTIETADNSYSANTVMKRVPKIDSLVQEFRENEIFLDDGIYVEFYARDFADTGDAYWIKAFKNGEFLNRASQLNIAFDSGFDSGSQIDGLIFIPPIREFVNELDNDEIDIPWNPGEVSKVEIHSLSVEAFNFLEITRDQINNGDNGIFSLPLANTRTNITSSFGPKPLGFFNVAAVSSRELTIK